MKKIIIAFLCATLLCGCGKKEEDSSGSGSSSEQLQDYSSSSVNQVFTDIPTESTGYYEKIDLYDKQQAVETQWTERQESGVKIGGVDLASCTQSTLASAGFSVVNSYDEAIKYGYGEDSGMLYTYAPLVNDGIVWGHIYRSELSEEPNITVFGCDIHSTLDNVKAAKPATVEDAQLTEDNTYYTMTNNDWVIQLGFEDGVGIREIEVLFMGVV